MRYVNDECHYDYEKKGYTDAYPENLTKLLVPVLLDFHITLFANDQSVLFGKSDLVNRLTGKNNKFSLALMLFTNHSIITTSLPDIY